jgi:hypothetical protein
MGEVIDMNPSSNPDTVLKEASKAFKEVLILGYNHEGYMEVRASTGLGDKAELLMLVEQFKHSLMSGDYDDD